MKNQKNGGRRIVKLRKGEKAAAKAGVSIWVGDRDLVGLATGTVSLTLLNGRVNADRGESLR